MKIGGAVAFFIITLDGLPVATVQNVSDDISSQTMTLHNVTLQGDGLLGWTGGSLASHSVDLLGKDPHGNVLYSVDLDEAQIVSLGDLTEVRGRRAFVSITVAER